MGLIAIGDIHGCARTLDLLLRTLKPEPDDHLVFVGDYVDRGPDSKGVIDRLLALEKTTQCTFLRGNHESLLLGYLDRGEVDIFLYNGGRMTLSSYAGNGNGGEVPSHHEAFIRRTKLYYETQKYLFVHAGLRPDLTVKENLEEGDEMVFLWERGHVGLTDDQLNWEKTVVCGHTPVSAPVNQQKLINLDTGCVFHKRADLARLTAVRLPEREFVTVPYVD